MRKVTFNTQSQLVVATFEAANPVQRTKLEQMLGMGWNVEKYIRGDAGTAVTLRSVHGAVAVLLPTGEVERPTANKPTVTVNLRTMTRK